MDVQFGLGHPLNNVAKLISQHGGFSGKVRLSRTMPTSVAHARRRLISLWNFCKNAHESRAPQLGHIGQYRLAICEIGIVKNGAGGPFLAVSRSPPRVPESAFPGLFKIAFLFDKSMSWHRIRGPHGAL
jgi:hypothetical protein